LIPLRAAIYYAAGDIRLEDVPEPCPLAGEVLVRVAHNGICGSDLHEYFSASKFTPTGQPHPLTGVTAPVILGHEFSGTVVDAGAGVDASLLGKRVAIRPTYSCGVCAACSRGLTQICRLLAFHGLSAAGGGLSEFTTLPAAMVHPLPENVSLELGALVEPMAVAHHAVRRVELTPNDLAVIVGAGPIGIGVWFALRAVGHERILVSEISAERRRAIASVGAEHVIDPRSESLMDTANTLSGNAGARAVFDAAGVGAAIVDSVPALAPRGTIIVVSIHEKPFPFDPTTLLLQEVDVVGSLVYDIPDDEEVIANMAAGRYDTSGWVTHIELGELLDGYENLRAGREMKVLVDL
jgi:(R,R)-butanediol dehydrogenase / meso-butanediol dehydrogenase / diacetyl reductase